MKLDLIRRLLRLANSDNQHEAAAARAEADRLMALYGISETEVEREEERSGPANAILGTMEPETPFLCMLLQHQGVLIIGDPFGQVRAVGNDDIAVAWAVQTYHHLRREFRRVWQEARDKKPVKQLSDPAAGPARTPGLYFSLMGIGYGESFFGELADHDHNSLFQGLMQIVEREKLLARLVRAQRQSAKAPVTSTALVKYRGPKAAPGPGDAPAGPPDEARSGAPGSAGQRAEPEVLSIPIDNQAAVLWGRRDALKIELRPRWPKGAHAR